MVAVLVMGAIAHSKESGYTDFSDPKDLFSDANKSVYVGLITRTIVFDASSFPLSLNRAYAEFFECVSAYFNCGQSL